MSPIDHVKHRDILAFNGHQDYDRSNENAMTFFSVTIPIDMLMALLMFMVVMAAYLIEVAAYYRFARWYYRTGPAILRERWQTAAEDGQIREVIRSVLSADELVGRESTEGFYFRQRGATINAWTRILLRIEEAERGVALHYEVRPFYTCAPLLPPVVWLAASAFGLGWLTLYIAGGSVAIVFVMYARILPWDVARFARLPTVRRALAPYGVLVCERCGYDLFGNTDANRCPECGSGSPAR